MEKKIQKFLDYYFEMSLDDDDDNRKQLQNAVDLLQDTKESQNELRTIKSNILTFIHKTVKNEYDIPEFKNKKEKSDWYYKQFTLPVKLK